MNKKIRAIGAGILAAVWLGLCAFAWLQPAKERSDSERRKLAQLPKLTAQALLDGSYMEKFADYAVDQFPLRDSFRSLKALFQQNVLLQKDNNGYFVYDGYLVKQTYPLNEASVNHAVSVMRSLYQAYLADTGCNLYLSVVPDKGYYVQGYPSMDYAVLQTRLEQDLSWADMIDISDTLELSDYYRTDTHWRQEKLMETAAALCQAMGVEAPRQQNFTQTKVSDSFYGVYYGHAAVPMEPEELYLMHSELLRGCTLTDLSTGKQLPLYDESKLGGADMYEVYLSGNQPLLKLENPNATTDRELVIFRDSFGSAIAPLLMSGYRSITLVDVRYVSAQMIGSYVTFDSQDVLFLYSTLVLNESATLRK